MPRIAGANEVWSHCRVKELRQWSAGKIRGPAVRVEGTEGKPGVAQPMDSQAVGGSK